MCTREHRTFPDEQTDRHMADWLSYRHAFCNHFEFFTGLIFVPYDEAYGQSAAQLTLNADGWRGGHELISLLTCRPNDVYRPTLYIRTRMS